MRRLLAYARPYWPMFLLSILLLVGVAAAELARPYLIKVAIDEHLRGWAQKDPAARQAATAAVWRLAFLLLGLQVAGFALGYGQSYLLQATSQRIIFQIRQDLFRHLQWLSLSFFDRNPVGRLVTRVTNDTEALNEMYTSVMVNLFRDLFTIVGILVVMVRMDLRLTLVSLAAAPLVALSGYLFERYSRQAWREVRARLSRINAFLAEHIHGMAVVQIFGREGREQEAFDRVNTDYLRASMRQLHIFAIFRPVVSFLSHLATALLVWYGGRAVLDAEIPLGTLVAFTSYIRSLFGPVEQLAEKFNILQQAMASSERIFSLMDEVPAVQDKPGAIEVGRLRGAVEFDHVWFAYEGENWVLKDVSFRVEPGQTVAFVGHTGAGKSSIMNLVARFYDVQRGAVRIDGIDVREMTQESLRRNLAVVLQDVFLFSGDIASNIRLGNTALDDEAVVAAARAVGADAFIQRLPGGYRAPVVERGATLSHGQRQLICFARALAFDPAILILDEATASIDSETERQIQEALKVLSRGRTTLIVAHRLSTIQHADRIFVLHKGQIRESGTHQELLAKKGIYYKLWQLQNAEVRTA
ncbi:MAG: ABC transporter ATP-binding protein/permease [Firmicutes bacterium]|nr:ABC transporter ATP-binding protein/permease [Bacillota bacterium]